MGDEVRIIGDDLAALHPEKYSTLPPASVVALSPREPCVVCGHPTGDCTSADHTGPNV